LENGQKAYEAFCNSLGLGLIMNWDGLPEKQKKAWVETYSFVKLD
jgi:hypothetical protein